MEFKVGDRIKHDIGGTGIIATREEVEKLRGGAIPSGAIPWIADNKHCGHIGHWAYEGSFTLIKSRVPLSEVSTAEDAEAWVGEEVEFHSAEGENCGWYAEGRGRLSGWNPSPKWSSGVWYITGNTPQNVHRPAEFIRPLTQEPVTPREGKPSEATGGELIVDRGARNDYTSEDPSKRCPHCRADLRAEAHTEDCPCRPVVKDEVVVDAAVLDREEWLDSLERLSHIDPWKLARWAKEGKPVMDE